MKENPLRARLPPKPEWKMYLGHKVEPVFMVPTAPNAFYRFMQRITLGIIWEKIK